jgi:hypothetical protein
MMACIAAVHCLFGLGLYPRLKDRTPLFLQDRDHYADIAANLAAGRGYSLGTEIGYPEVGPHHPTLRRMPAYPLLLAAVNRLAGPDSVVLFLAQLSLLLAACAWIYRIGARVDHLTGLLAMLLLGAYPQVISYAPRAYSETLLVFFVSGVLYAALRFLEEGRWAHLAAAAALAGGAFLTRSAVGLWLVPVAVLLVRSDAARGRRLKVALAAAGIFALLLVPWLARNWRVSEAVVAGTTWNTRSALAGLRVMTHPWGERYSRELDEMYHRHMNWEIERRIGPVNSARQEVRESAEWGRLYWQELRERPAAAISACAHGFVRVFFQTASPPMRWLIGLSNLLLALLATAGATVARGAPTRGGGETAKRRNGETAGEGIEHRTSNIEHRTSNSDPQTGIQELTTEAQRTQRETQIPGPKSEVRSPMSAGSNPQSAIPELTTEAQRTQRGGQVSNPQSAIRNPQSEYGTQELRKGIENSQFAIRNSQSDALRTPHSALRIEDNLKSAMRNFLPILWWIVGVTYVFYSVVYPLTRYMVVALPALAVLAAVGGARLARRWFGPARVDEFTSRL